ncbi:MAG: hypothetical protein MPJ24_11380 [Pirellulaceae bacterium]|nr:hypothetical protein [Pirellulaceae bacterium]
MNRLSLRYFSCCLSLIACGFLFGKTDRLETQSLETQGYPANLMAVAAKSTTIKPISDDPLLEKLKKLPGVEVEKKSPSRDYKNQYVLKVTQPLDHEDPESGTFVQYVYLSVVDTDKPMVMITAGYATSGSGKRELAEIFDANQVTVEHRYYGLSVPNPVVWKHLTIKQSADDLHHVRELLAPLFPNKWISTGVSKGGETALLYRRFYPDDVDATVAYVAPINLAQEDPRLDDFIFNKLGTAESRAKISNFQLELLKRRESLIPKLKKYAQRRNMKFSIGYDVAFEYAVVEYPFAFWQYGVGVDKIPTSDSNDDEIFRHLLSASMFELYSDRGIKRYEASFYQHMIELGYYGFKTDHLEGLLTAVPNPTNLAFGPKGVDMTYREGVMQDIHDWLVNKGDKIIYIYGGLDAWSGTAIELQGKTDALKLVHPTGAHGTNLRSFPKREQKKVYRLFKKWLSIPIHRLDKVSKTQGIGNLGSSPEFP